MKGGCLNRSSTRRLLPPSAPVKSRRRLHSGFWTHGASSLDLQESCDGATVSTQALDESFVQFTLQSSFGPARFMLDFLYPTQTQATLRRYSSRWKLARAISHSLATRRLYSATVEDANVDVPYDGTVMMATPAHSTSETTTFAEIIGDSKQNYDKAWIGYCQQDPVRQSSMRSDLIKYLSTSERTADADRTIQLLEQGSINMFDVEIRAAEIRALLRLGRLEKAKEAYFTVLETTGQAPWAALLLSQLVEASAWNASQWRSALEVGSRTLEHLRTFHETQDQSTNILFKTLLQQPELIDRLSEMVDFLENRGPKANVTKITPGSADSSEVDGQTEQVYVPDAKSKHFARLLLSKALISSPAKSSQKTLERLIQHLESYPEVSLRTWEDCIEHFILLGHNKLAYRCYETQRCRDSRFRIPVLNALMNAFNKDDNITGMQSIIDDWFRIYQRPSRSAYRIMIWKHAHRGDVKNVLKHFEEFGKTRNTPIVKSADDLAPLLHVYAKRGDIKSITELFDSMGDEYNIVPNLRAWNILINAYCQSGDLDGAFERFKELLAQGIRADAYTIGPLMGTCLARRDLDGLQALLKQAEKFGIKRNLVMTDCLVLGYLQNGMYNEAEQLCEESVNAGFDRPTTRMWNYLVKWRANLRDLESVNQLLGRMKKLGIPYDSVTYAAFMQALCMVSQPDRAFSILHRVMPNAGLKPSHVHYAILMGGYLATGQINKMFKTYGHMTKAAVRGSTSTNLMALKAFAAKDEMNHYKDLSNYRDESAPDTITYQAAEQCFLRVIGLADRSDNIDPLRHGFRSESANLAHMSSYFEFLIFVFGKNRDVTRVEELLNKFRAALPESQHEDLPLRIITALIETQYQAGDNKAVEKTWNSVLKKATRLGQPSFPKSAQADKVMFPHRLALCYPLSIYMRVLAEENRLPELVKVIKKLEERGFALDRHNWNIYVQLLAEKKQYKLAFSVCEQNLMSGWTGWARVRQKLPMRNRLPIELRRARRQKTFLRPNSVTMSHLVSLYVDLQAFAVESNVAQSVLTSIERACPATVEAVVTMRKDRELGELSGERMAPDMFWE